MKESWEIHWKDYFKILQIDPLAEPEVVKAAHDRLLHKYHPDHNPGKEQWANEKTKEINEAFETISNPEKRRRYYSEYLLKQGQEWSKRPIITPYSSQPQPQQKPPPAPQPSPKSAATSVTRADSWCYKCKKVRNLKVLFINKEPAYYVCPACNTCWDIRLQTPHNTKDDDRLPPDVKRRLEELRSKIRNKKPSK